MPLQVHRGVPKLLGMVGFGCLVPQSCLPPEMIECPSIQSHVKAGDGFDLDLECTPSECLMSVRLLLSSSHWPTIHFPSVLLNYGNCMGRETSKKNSLFRGLPACKVCSLSGHLEGGILLLDLQLVYRRLRRSNNHPGTAIKMFKHA